MSIILFFLRLLLTTNDAGNVEVYPDDDDYDDFDNDEGDENVRPIQNGDDDDDIKDLDRINTT